MPASLLTSIDPMSIATAHFDQLQRAWNEADGAAFGREFSDDTDFVNIRGEHHRGDPAAIARSHQALFESIYAGSTVRYQVGMARLVAPGCVVAVTTSTLVAPTGPLQGTNQSRITTVITEDDGRWSIAAFHNTLVRESA